MSELNGQRVLVLGLGETGASLARWLTAAGAQVRVADSRMQPPGLDTLRRDCPAAEIFCGDFSESLLQGVTRIAISPGVPMTTPLVQRALALGIPVEGDVELLAQELAQSGGKSETRVIAITGSNGKTTVTSMVGAMCRAAGLDTEVAGNISPAVLDVLLARKGRQPQVWVLELSSFQLETTYSLKAAVATVLNVSEDHLDRYAGMNEYAAAKARIFSGDGMPLLNRDDALSLAMAQPAATFGLNPPKNPEDWGIVREDGVVWLVQGTQKIMRADELPLAGLHNVANALAALGLCRALALPLDPLVNALRQFRGLPHRVEAVAEIDGVMYYDDSKGTNVGATVAALQGLERSSVVILGGEGKGQDFSPLKAAVARHARAVILIGRDAQLIAEALRDSGVPLIYARGMEDAVRQAARFAERGDAVLLSPACASFDMYRNYVHRAEVFVAAVQDLCREAA
ncbi:MAG: UDP-N-acetylmuramoyl-L-alanine--D-glutamate ligase [Gallionella sp.]|jgi:UDP-N-acetylmuramoylalanine--D-glutamate ligase|nr:UDP-N-acetylmuramoyl-L-alanine--D-glutamate ligase [Gallionella sp.]